MITRIGSKREFLTRYFLYKLVGYIDIEKLNSLGNLLNIIKFKFKFN